MTINQTAINKGVGELNTSHIMIQDLTITVGFFID
jgi:hypothetical protein